MDYLSICAIVKDENSYLPEWIAYHRAVGVERFLIYDNGSKIRLADRLQGEIAAGIVAVRPITGVGVQMAAYMDGVWRLRNKSRWVAFIDVDEFIVPKSTDDLRAVLEGYEKHGGLGINWQNFGTSGHTTRPVGLQIENFLIRGPRDWNWNSHIKTIARPEMVLGMSNPHWCHFHPDFECVNENGLPTKGAFNSPVTIGKAQINHYFTRSNAEYAEKMVRGAADSSIKTMEYFDICESGCNVERDEAILRFVEPTKRILSGNLDGIPQRC